MMTDYVSTILSPLHQSRLRKKQNWFMDIADAFLSNNELECPTKDEMFLHNGVRLTTLTLCLNYNI